jgi:hypothetical protein
VQVLKANEVASRHGTHLDPASARTLRFSKPYFSLDGADETSEMYAYPDIDTSTPTALHKACLRGNLKLLEHLLHVLQDRNLDTIDHNGETALHICARTGNYRACEILCEVN